VADEPGGCSAANAVNRAEAGGPPRAGESWTGPASPSRRGLLRGAGALAAAAALGPGRAAAAQAGPSAPGQTAERAVPGLDELAGAWMSAGTLLNMPSVSNFSGSLHVGANLLSFGELTLPPLSLGGECASLSLNGVNVQAHESRWYPYQVLRAATVGAIVLESVVRMAFEQPVVLLELDVTNTAAVTLEAGIDIQLGGYLRSYPGTWQWTIPRQYDDFSAWTSQLAGGGTVLAVTDSESTAAAAFAFGAQPDALTAQGGSGTASWQLALRPGERRTIQLVMAAGTVADAAVDSATLAASRFPALFGQAKAFWERRFADAFTPGNGHFSGSLPVLVTADRELRDLYYRGVASLLALERTSYPQYFPRVYTTAGPQWGVTLSYFWDTSLFAPLLVLLDPAMASQQAKRWLELGIYNGYAVDALSGALVGPWYSANDLSVFTMLLSYVTLTGDMGFLDEQAGGTSVIDHMQAIALHWQQLEVPATGLADYGAQGNLLEEVPDYVNQVPSLNAANVWMMRQLAALRQDRGETAVATQLLQLAQDLAGRVLGLYVPGQGYWESVHDDGTRVAVRHVYDFDTIGRLMTDDLTPATRSEMATFATTQLLADDWMRALSLADPDAAVSLRPDHGSNGAYDAWPALAASAMASLGYYGPMVQMLRGFDAVGAEGPFAQSHQLVPEPSGLVVWERTDLNPTGQLTVSAWISPASWPGTYDQAPASGSILSKAAAAGAWFPTTPPNVGYTLSGGAGGVISFGAAVGGRLREVVATAAVPTGSWHHVAGTFNGTELAIYIDGKPAGSAAVSGSLSPSTGTNLMVGADPINPVSKFTGAVDEVRVYSRALSAAEIAAACAAGDAAYGGDDPALVLRLPMDEGHGTRTADAVTGLEETIIAGRWVPGRYGSALYFAESRALTHRISRQQYNENNGASFASTILTDLFGYAPDGQRIALRDPGTPRGVTGSLRGIAWKGRSYTLTSTSSGISIVPPA
jgi:concanavalin A-like lectin/glucanase superfamily protein